MTTQSVRDPPQLDCCVSRSPSSASEGTMVLSGEEKYGLNRSECYSNCYRGLVPDDEERCMACSSFNNVPGLCTNDPFAHIDYISSQVALNERVYHLVKHACLRSLSCEVSGSTQNGPPKLPLKGFSPQFSRTPAVGTRPVSFEESWLDVGPEEQFDGLVFFGDDLSGYTLSHTFRLRDAKARGFQRWFSLIILSMDKFLITNNYDFFVSGLSSIIKQLQDQALSVFRVECNELTNECLKQATASRASLLPAHFLRSRVTKLDLDTSRSLSLITGCPTIFTKLHKQMTWLLRTQTRLVVENVLEGVPSQDALVQLELQPVELNDLELEFSSVIDNDYNSLVHVTSLQHLARRFSELPPVRGVNVVDILLTQLVQGAQVVVRCDDIPFTRQFLLSLSDLLPIGCIRFAYSDNYQYVFKYNMLGCPRETRIPRDVVDALVISIELSEPTEDEVSSMSFGVSPEESAPVISNEFPKIPPSFDGVQLRPEEKTISKEDILSRGLAKVKRDYERCTIFVDIIPTPLPSNMPSIVVRYRQLLLDAEIEWRALEVIIRNTREQWLNKAKLIYQLSRQKEGIDLKKVISIVKCTNDDIPVLRFWQAGLSKVYKQHVLNTINNGERLYI